MSQADCQDWLHDQLRSAIGLTPATILAEQVPALTGAPRYGRVSTRRDQRNGYCLRDLVTNAGRGNWIPAISEMFVFGASTPGWGKSPRPGPALTPAHRRSRAFFIACKTRGREVRDVDAFADGTEVTVQYDDPGQPMPILAVIGLTQAASGAAGERENQAAREDLREQLKTRGVQTVGWWITDGNQALLNAVPLKFPAALRPRRVKPERENALGVGPDPQREQVAPELKGLFHQDSRVQADPVVAACCAKYAQTYPTAVECLQHDWDACRTVYASQKRMGRPSVPPTSLSADSMTSSAAATRWPPPSATKGAAYCCSWPSSAHSNSVASQCLQRDPARPVTHNLTHYPGL